MSRPMKKSRKLRIDTSHQSEPSTAVPYREILDLWSLDAPPSPKLVIDIPSSGSESCSTSPLGSPLHCTPHPPSQPPPSRLNNSNSSNGNRNSKQANSSFVDRYLSNTSKSSRSARSTGTLKSSLKSTPQSSLGTTSTLVGEGYIYGPYSAIPRVDPVVCVDWAKTHMLAIALDGEDDNFQSELKSLFQQVSENPSSLETLNLYPTALRLLHQLHSELHCPPAVHKKFWKVYCKPSTGNFAVVLTRLSTLSHSRYNRYFSLACLMMHRSHLLDVLRFASGNPTPQLISRLLRMKRHGHDDTRQMDIQRFSMMGQSPDQIRARARATILHSPHPPTPQSNSLSPAPPLPQNLAEKIERKKLQSSLSVIHEDSSEDEDDEEEEEVSDRDDADNTDRNNIPIVTLKHIYDTQTDIADTSLKPLQIPERKRSQRSSTSTARTGLLKRIVEEWIQSVPWHVCAKYL